MRGARTPFVLSGGEFNDYMAYDLQVWNRCSRPHPPCTPPAIWASDGSMCGVERGSAGASQVRLHWTDAIIGLFA